MGTDYEVDGIRIETNSGGREKEKMRLESYEKHRRYMNEYASVTYDNVVLRIRHDGGGKGVLEGITREGIKAAAAAAGMSMSEYILERACESMRRRGEVLGLTGAERNATKNEIFMVRGDVAAEIIATARGLGEEPRDMILKAVRDYYERNAGNGGNGET